MEVFAQMDKDKEKQEPEPKRSFALPALGLCLLLLLGTSGYVYYHKWIERPDLPQIKQVQVQEKEPKEAINKTSAVQVTPVNKPQTISLPITATTQSDNTLSLFQEKTHDKEADKPNNVSLQEEQPIPTPAPLLVQPDGDETRVEKLVMPQLQKQIQDLLQEATSDLLLEQSPPVIEEQNQKNVTLLPPEKSLPKSKQDKTLPATPKRSQELQKFLAGGSFAGVKKSNQKNQPVQNEEKSVPLSSPINTKKQPKVEPAPANVIDWLLKKKEQRAP